MKSFLLHPIFIFVVLQIVSVTLTVLWVIWYVNQSSMRFVNSYDLAFLVTGCILTGITLLGTVLLFVFAIKQSRLNTQQRSFISSVTHELRSPIASIQLSLETLQRQSLDGNTTKKLFGMMASDLERLVTLVDQILVSARLDRGIKIFEEVEAFSLASVIRSAIDNACHWDQGLSNRVEIHCPDDLILITARPAVQLILNNLLENAVKYSPTDKQIIVSAKQIDHQILVTVKDLGFGLEKREQKKIFKIFHRGHVATKGAIPGTGLGLYIVRAVVKVLGGKVWAESSGKGLGSTFCVQLPVRDSDESPSGLL